LDTGSTSANATPFEIKKTSPINKAWLTNSVDKVIKGTIKLPLYTCLTTVAKATGKEGSPKHAS
jgi:hypothetical protein